MNSAGTFPLFKWFSPVLPICACLLALPVNLRGETLVVEILVNQVSKGDFFVVRAGPDRFLLNESDVPALGVQLPGGMQEALEGGVYRVLATVPELEWRFDENRLALELTVPPRFLPATTLDFSSQRQYEVYYPRETSAFFNYRLGYATLSGSTGDSVDVGTELGYRTGDWLFLSNQRYEQAPGGSRWSRALTSLTRDRRDERQRLVLGDYLTPPGELEGSLSLAGVSFSHRYDMDPYFIRYPTVDYAGAVTLPSEMEIYQDGIKIRSEQLPPGEFHLENLFATAGAGMLELVLRDSFGRERHIQQPYYLSDRLLKRGLQEFSYSIGLLRQGAGGAADAYHGLAATAWHRYGWSDRVTFSFGGQAGDSVLFLSPRATLLSPRFGILSVTTGASSAPDGVGVAGGLHYLFNRRPFSSRVQLQGFSRDFTSVGSRDAVDPPRWSSAAGLGWGSAALGSLAVDLKAVGHFAAKTEGSVALSYGRRLLGSLGFTLTLQQQWRETSSWSLFAALQYFPWAAHQVSARLEAGKESNSQVLQLQKNTPPGEGFGYLAALGRTATAERTTLFANPSLQYNGPVGIYRGEARFEGGDGAGESSLSASAAGALTWIGGVVRAARPVDDSFALVQVGRLSGVRVYQNAQEMGRTDAAGQILLPTLHAFYENQVSINDKDIPLNYSFTSVARYLSPPARSGSCLHFAVNRFQPVTGTLHLRRDGQLTPVEFRELVVTGGGRSYRLPTGRGGSFTSTRRKNSPPPACPRCRRSRVAGRWKPRPPPKRLPVMPPRWWWMTNPTRSAWTFPQAMSCFSMWVR